MTRVAIVGAGGFVGSRLFEMAMLGAPDLHGCTFVPIVRYPRALARLSRFGGIDYRFADAARPETLRDVFRDCDVVVNLTMGNDSRILPDLQNLYSASQQAGVSRLIHLSSAAVFGRCDTPNLTDDSNWPRDLWMRYAREKGRAEDWIRGLPEDAPVSVTTLRPGLIWGPKSDWVAGPAQAIFDGSAFLIDGGRWACNLCFVDNLVRAIVGVARSTSSGGFYNIGDPDRPTWKGYYTALAAEMGIADPLISEFAESDFRMSFSERLNDIRNHPTVLSIKSRLSSTFKNAVKKKISQIAQSIRPRISEAQPTPNVSRGLWSLQTTRYLLPITKFDLAYPDVPQIGFTEAMKRTGHWLRFAGFAATDRPMN